jgi:hypothetical protein
VSFSKIFLARNSAGENRTTVTHTLHEDLHAFLRASLAYLRNIQRSEKLFRQVFDKN